MFEGQRFAILAMFMPRVKANKLSPFEKSGLTAKRGAKNNTLFLNFSSVVRLYIKQSQMFGAVVPLVPPQAWGSRTDF